MRTKLQTSIAALMLAIPTLAAAVEGTRPAYTPPPPAVSSGNIMQIIFSLLLVLAAIVLVAWLLKRMNIVQQGSGYPLKVLGGVSIGQRERIVLVEVNDTWLVVGVGPGQIRTLHTLQKAEIPAADLQATENHLPENKFASLLSSIISHRKHGTGNK
ncbi:flagellar biosynthetic protein FliO [Candidatus Ferrigenium straubiae]|jgi:flagellar protein FliO/FliZ|uniref:flagellar biosynthetic protein FliO n=1 Tax=Candidatus Ferrigenium straubiae TaxID=2919506 RepID=UPI003F4AE502